MNDAHLHLVVNHFPIIGTILGLGILVSGIVIKNNAIKNTAYVVFSVVAIFAFLSMATGEGAEEIVEDMPNIGKQIIHEHEEMAEKLAVVLYVLGIVSLIGLYTNFKNNSKATIISYIAVVIASLGALLAQQTGTTGGEIRHTEIRDNALPNSVEKQNADTENEE
jgi:uncharacterized membrane protein